MPPPSGGGYDLRRRLPDAGVPVLQLCRPLPGAVTTRARNGWLAHYPLQLCRPLPGAVTSAGLMATAAISELQLCRPLPGAVTWKCSINRAKSGGFNCAAPFRGRLRAGDAANGAFLDVASIVPPPSGGGYLQLLCQPCHSAKSFNCAAPFRGRLRRCGGPGFARLTGFNCAAPFRGRLLALRPLDPVLRPASIVPPPSGGGYKGNIIIRPDGKLASIVPPPSGGGYWTTSKR